MSDLQSVQDLIEENVNLRRQLSGQKARIDTLESIVRKRDNKIHKLQKKNKANRERLDKAVSLVRELSRLVKDGDSDSWQASAALEEAKALIDG